MNTLTRYRRRAPISNLQGEVNRLFESLFPETVDENGESQTAVWSPRMDLTESAETYHLHMDLPGVSKDQVSIQVEDNRLTIRGERKDEVSSEKEDMIRVERSFGTFYRTLRLPKAVDANKIEASFSEGVLSVNIPKTEKSKPKKIKIS